MTSKLETINDSLKNNSNALVINRTKDRDTYLPKTSEEYRDRTKRNLTKYFRDEIVIWVAPKKGLYIPKELNRFMRDLFPNLRPKKVECFKYDERFEPQKDCLIYGLLKFQEAIGSERIVHQRVLELTDTKLKNHKDFKNFVNGRLGTDLSGKRNIYREIVICPVPNENIGKGILRAYPHTNSTSAIDARSLIPLELLEKYKTKKSKSGLTRDLYKTFGKAF